MPTKRTVSAWVASRIKRDKKDFKLQFFTASVKAGGAGKDTSNTACRITDIQTGISAECQEERSQKTNRERAFLRLANKLIEHYQRLEIKERAEDAIRNTNLGWIRNYEEKGALVTDKRVLNKVFDYNEILNGRMDSLVNELTAKDGK